MKYILCLLLPLLTSCSMMPFFIEETEKAIEFESDAIRDEIKIRSSLVCNEDVWEEIQNIEKEERLRRDFEDYYWYHFG